MRIQSSRRVHRTIAACISYLGVVTLLAACNGPVHLAKEVPVAGVALDQKTLTVGVGSPSVGLVATVAPENAANQRVTWSSSDTRVATVSRDGELHALAKGTATITVTTADGGFTDACIVSVGVAVTGVSLDQRTLRLAVGTSSAALVATVVPEDAANRDVTWSSSDKAVATVSQNGEVSAAAQGSATIRVTTNDGGFFDECTVAVGAAVTGVSLDQKTLSMVVGSSSVTLAATVVPEDAANQSVTWSSNDTGVATVSEDGEVSPVAEGTAMITATTADGGFTDACSVSVGVAATGVALNQKAVSLVVGTSSVTLVATVAPENATNKSVTWSSSNASVATVSGDGEVNPVAQGEATITVTTDDGGLTDTCTVSVIETVAWVMSYFGPEQDLAADSLHLAYSKDGLHWRALNTGAPVYQLGRPEGTNHIRDPFILRKRDGTFVYMATDWTRDDNPGYWSNPSPNIFVADSADLITFTNPRLMQATDLSGANESDMHAWAPEAFWDPTRNRYAIVWSGNDTRGTNRIYVSYTDDFVTVDDPTPDVFFDPQYSVIDATIVKGNDRSYLFFKDETYESGSSLTGSGKDIQIARATGPEPTAGTFERWDPDYITRGADQSVRQATEGPFVVELPDENRWYMYADYYLNGGVFGCWTTTDLDTDPSLWTKLPDTDIRLPPGVRHANTVRVTQAELDALLDEYGSDSLLRTTYSEGGTPFYFAHSYYHGIVTQLADRTDGQLANDFYWHIVPGLADPTDTSLVSFVAAGYPDRYARIDSTNPNRYPSCTNNAANRSEGLCAYVPKDERNHLVWVDPYEDTDTFKADATFRVVGALSGDPSMVSFQWYQDSTRHLRHIGYQMLAHVADTPQEKIDASFTIE